MTGNAYHPLSCHKESNVPSSIYIRKLRNWLTHKSTWVDWPTSWGPFLLTWITFNSIMGKWSHVSQSVGWNYLSITKPQQLCRRRFRMCKGFISHYVMAVIISPCWYLKSIHVSRNKIPVYIHACWMYSISVASTVRFLLLYGIWSLNISVIMMWSGKIMTEQA